MFSLVYPLSLSSRYLNCTNMANATHSTEIATTFCIPMNIFPSVILLFVENSPFTTSTGRYLEMSIAGIAPARNDTANIAAAPQASISKVIFSFREISFPNSIFAWGPKNSMSITARMNDTAVRINASLIYREEISHFCSPNSLRVAISFALKPIWATVSDM